MKTTQHLGNNGGTIETTLGDLISAICDAAEEAQVSEQDWALVAKNILDNLFTDALRQTI